jgi:hypothetical protein
LTAVIIAWASQSGAARSQTAAFPAPFEGLFSSAIDRRFGAQWK